MRITENEYRDLGRQALLDPQGAMDDLSEALRHGWVKPEDYSIRELAECLVSDGREWVRSLNPRFGNGMNTLESAGQIDTTQFANITGQLIYNKLLNAADYEDNVFTGIIPHVDTAFNGERIAGVSNLGDQAQIVGEGQPFPLAGVAEDFIDTPQTIKRGEIVAVTKEAIFFDRTNLVIDRAAKVGLSLALNKEKRIIDGIIDENTTAHQYKWRGTVIPTYGANAGTHTWNNLQANNALVDWVTIDAVEKLLGSLLDPNTGEPMVLYADTLIVPNSLTNTAWRILAATMVNLNAPGFATAGNPTMMASPSPTGQAPLSAKYRIVTSRQLTARMGTKTSWYLGRPTAAFAYMQNWPLKVEQAMSNSEVEFTNDIALRYKASERGAMTVIDPRYMAKSTA